MSGGDPRYFGGTLLGTGDCQAVHRVNKGSLPWGADGSPCMSRWCDPLQFIGASQLLVSRQAGNLDEDLQRIVQTVVPGDPFDVPERIARAVRETKRRSDRIERKRLLSPHSVALS
jgi:hypothetical protein